MRFLILFSTLLVACSAYAHAAEGTRTKIRVALAGDSTVTDKAGWGAAFSKLLKPDAECMNFAAGGQSSKSFRESGQWKKVIDARPDIVFIQFGHNDMLGKGPKRETDPATTYRENMSRFVDEVRALGGEPILVTSMARRVFSGDKVRGELKPRADAVRKIAEEKRVPLVDLFERSVALLEQLGPEKSEEFNPPGKDGKLTDRTHLNAKGAVVMAKIVADEARRVSTQVAQVLR